MRKKNTEDVERVRRFRQWVKGQMEIQGFDPSKKSDREQMADNFNSQREDYEPTITESAMRQYVERQLDIATINRQSCRVVALALKLDINEVLMQAGYLPSDEYLQLKLLPIRTQIGDLRLPKEVRIGRRLARKRSQKVTHSASATPIVLQDQVSPDVPDAENRALIALLRQWREEDAAMTEEEAQQADANLKEFKANMNANREATGERSIY